MSRFGIVKGIVAALVFVIGAGVLVYPALSNYVNERAQTTAITNYEEAVAALTDEDRAKSLEAARSYNESLVGNQAQVVDPFGEVEPAEHNEVSFLTVGEVMGYVQIPKIDIKAPIYEGTSEDVLQKGIGWLKGTSLPVGGESTNSVLTGHRGLPTAKLFTDLDKLEESDEFFVRTGNEILAYRVIATKVIDPDQSEELAVVEGSDRMTLLTCHPYMVNSHRLLVIGERIPYTGQLEAIAEAKGEGVFESLTAGERDLALTGLAVLAFVAVLVLVLWKPWRTLKKRGEEA
ncbi:class C sortase [Raoultibacter phocaeensis]|uniref:class C sortase n=1 Tax=Raoultibacter phocaeensis TaxID=2479841 RepID=UPI0015D5FF56|nr:class C sortase [Raoultibacter phocaeensis]